MTHHLMSRPNHETLEPLWDEVDEVFRAEQPKRVLEYLKTRRQEWSQTRSQMGIIDTPAKRLNKETRAKIRRMEAQGITVDIVLDIIGWFDTAITHFKERLHYENRP